MNKDGPSATLGDLVRSQFPSMWSRVMVAVIGALVLFLIGDYLLSPSPPPVKTEPHEERQTPSRSNDESALSEEEARQIYVMVDAVMMGAREEYSEILIDPIRWRNFTLEQKEAMLWRLGQARLRRFGYARVEVLDGYSGKRLGGYSEADGPWLEGG